MISNARKRANEKWNRENLERVSVSVNKGVRETWKGYADKMGISFAKFIKDAVEEKAIREGLDT